MNSRTAAKSKHPVSLIVHGGAWNIPDTMVGAHRAGVLKALNTGWRILHAGGSAVEAVEQSIVIMENDETFDAGRGSFLNAAGEIELDASIMNGKTFRAGAVAAVQGVPNPITLARAVMERSDHVLLVGKGAARFAKEHRIPTCGMDDLIIEREIVRWRESQTAGGRRPAKGSSGTDVWGGDTVGAVALDASGTIASGTSTGGTPNKYPGRVGDSPIIGAGAYADNAVGGVSSTGWGEALIKVVMAKSVIDVMAHNGGDPEAATREGIALLKKKVAGYGGVIAVSRSGKIGLSYNTPRMAHAYISSFMKSAVVAV